MAEVLAGARKPAVWTLAALSTAGYGALYYAQPLLAVATEAQTGWTRLHTGAAFTAALLVTALLAPGVGRALDRHGGRALLTAGAGLGALALLLLATAPPYPLYVLAWLLAGAAMALTFYEATFTVLAQTVTPARRPRATLTVTLVAGLASTVFVPLTTAFLLAWQLRGALLGLGALLLLAALACWLTLPTSAGRERAAPPIFVPDTDFARLQTALTLARIASVGLGLQLVPLLLAAGHAPALAAGLGGLMGLAALPGRALFLPLLERHGLRSVTVALLCATGAAALLLIRPTVAAAILGIVLFGMANGALTLARSELLLAAYPPEVYGAANGRLARPVNLAQALTPLGLGALYSASGAYLPSLLLCAGLSMGAAWIIGRRP